MTADGGVTDSTGSGRGVAEGGIILIQDSGFDGGGSVECDGGKCRYALADAGPYCGDSVVSPELGEICDDGNKLGGDGCSGTCKIIEPNFECPATGGPCRSTVGCGNGQRDTAESCDDGNTTGGDGCGPDCRVEPGWFCPREGEPCQRLVNCGDGRISAGENCDDGNQNPGDGCSPSCQVEEGWRCRPHLGCERIPVCGDGVVAEGKEECDDGNLIDGDGCSSKCLLEASYYACPPGGGPCVDTSACGNGVLEQEERCDDGNTTPGDGCDATCNLEPGWQCRKAGAPCVPNCGDGQINAAGGEQCDDGNKVNGDGCSISCLIEPGASCSGQPSVCTMAVCGNGVQEAGESCDLGENNGLFYGDGQGCSKTCTREPTCRSNCQTRACDTVCGDANREAGEACDDGNQVNGDGCSSTCQVEAGFTCTDQQMPDTQACSSGGGECLILPVIYRDFEGQQVNGGHPDFFYLGASATGGRKTGVVPGATQTTCVPNAGTESPSVLGQWRAGDACLSSDAVGPCEGLVKATLDCDGKPELAKNTCPCIFTDWDNTGLLGTCSGQSCTTKSGLSGVGECWIDGQGDHRLRVETTVTVIESTDSFRQWYRPSDYSTEVRRTLELEQIGNNLYQFSSSDGRTVYDDIHDICLGDGTTLESGFFPLEDQPRQKVCNIWPYFVAGLSTKCCAGEGCPVGSQWDPQAEYGNCPNEGTGGPVSPVNGMLRNFYFTTEVRYLFRYDGNPATLEFYGDDDVWVFVNGQLALDLGGPHERSRGAVSVNSRFGLEAGRTYEIVVFHADRHPRESNYQLTLSGFTTVRSFCGPTCGDGVKTGSEECDLGAENNDTLYNGCTTECKYGPFCGDGIVQPEGGEECDDGVNTTVGYQVSGCAPGCKLPPRCGDGRRDAGEECDEGANNQDGYGSSCSTQCTINPYCGDGNVDTQYGEECDDGINTGGYGYCDVGCKLGPRCGDGVVQPEGGEQCDDGELNGQPDHCTADCGVPGYCGDSKVQPELGEECDLGSNTGEYGGCTPDCKLGPYCGDGVVQPEAGEECDYGPNNSPPESAEYGGCLTTCKLGPHCGDGIVNKPDEQCDDGNHENQDGCNENCIQEIEIAH